MLRSILTSARSLNVAVPVLAQHLRSSHPSLRLAIMGGNHNEADYYEQGGADCRGVPAERLPGRRGVFTSYQKAHRRARDKPADMSDLIG